jgi:hypothetical protein
MGRTGTPITKNPMTGTQKTEQHTIFFRHPICSICHIFKFLPHPPIFSPLNYNQRTFFTLNGTSCSDEIQSPARPPPAPSHPPGPTWLSLPHPTPPYPTPPGSLAAWPPGPRPAQPCPLPRPAPRPRLVPSSPPALPYRTVSLPVGRQKSC